MCWIKYICRGVCFCSLVVFLGLVYCNAMHSKCTGIINVPQTGTDETNRHFIILAYLFKWIVLYIPKALLSIIANSYLRRWKEFNASPYHQHPYPVNFLALCIYTEKKQNKKACLIVHAATWIGWKENEPKQLANPLRWSPFSFVPGNVNYSL